MRKNYFLVLLAILLTANGIAQNIPSYVPKDGLVGYWPFNGNANDASGNGNHSTNNGATMTTDRNGKANSAYNFDGNSSIYNNGNDLKTLIDNNNSFSVSLWFKQNDNHVTLTDYDEMVLFAIDGQNINPYKRVWTLLGQSNTNTYFEFQRFNNDTGTNNSRESLDSIYADSKMWHNLTIIFDNSKNMFEMIYDGNSLKKINTFNTTLLGDMSSNDNSVIGLTFGANNQGNRAKFNGKLDDIAIYNRALTEQEITALYTENNPCTSVPIATIKPKGPTTFVQGDTLILKASSAAGQTFQWKKDSVIIAGATDSIYKVTTSGNYTVTITDQTGLCAATSAGELVTVTPKIIPSIPSYIPANGLVGYWPFNGNANDESGNGNHGTVNGATLSADRSGKSNSAYSFDGLTNYIEVVDNNSLDLTNNYTLSVWVNIPDYSEAPSTVSHDKIRTILGKPKNSGWAANYYIHTNPNGSSSYSCTGAVNMTCCNNTGVCFTTINPIKKWFQIISVYNGTTLKIYKNGVLSDSINNTYSLDNSSESLYFGKEFNTVTENLYRWFKGQIDDIAIYNRALTTQEISNLYLGCSHEAASSNAFNSFYLTSDKAVDLVASPTGGSFSGTGVKQGKFEPASAKIGLNKVVYNYKNSTGCEDVTEFKLVVADTIGTICKFTDTIKITKTETKYDTVTVTNNITKYDTITITNNVTKYDTVIVPKTVTKYDTVKVNTYDTITVTNNVTKYDTVKVNTYDTITVTNNVTKYDTVKVNTYDTITVTNNVTKYDTVIVKTNVFDTVKVNTYDTITVTNNVTKYDTVIVPKTVTKYDTITFTNTVTKYDTVIVNKTKYDTVIVPKTITKYDTVKVNTYDTITLTNTVTKYDTITVTDTVNILKINFKLTTGIKANQMTSMSIYPNPTSDVLIIDASDLAAIIGYSYRILDVLGKEVYNALVTSAKTEISLKTLGAKGMYVLHILDANKLSVQTKQIVLE